MKRLSNITEDDLGCGGEVGRGWGVAALAQKKLGKFSELSPEC